MQFGGLNPFRGKQDGATAFCLTLAFRTADRGPRSLLGQLDSLAADADTSSEDGIAALCADTALLLLRRKQEWLYCCGEAKDHGRDEAALERFDRLAIREAAKFDDRDSSATVDAALAAAGVAAPAGGPPTAAVVCAVGCLAGDREAALGGADFAGSATAMQTALEELAAARAEDALAFELFWVPGDDSEALEMEEVVLDWPQLMPC